MRAVGVGYRHPLSDWIASRPTELECLELTAEHFFDREDDVIRRAVGDLPVFVHGLGASLGTPGDLDSAWLANFRRVVDAVDPAWISEHVAFTRTGEVDLGHLNPIVPDDNNLALLVDHAIALREACDGRPLILENITSHVRLEGTLSETDFLNQLCEDAACGLLLDVTNLLINARNHGFDPVGWLDDLDLARVRQLHVVGYGEREGRLVDLHAAPIQDDVFDLVETVVGSAPVEAVIIERDADFPHASELALELMRLREILHAA